MIANEYFERRNNKILIILGWLVITFEIINNLVNGYYQLVIALIAVSFFLIIPTISFLSKRWERALKYQITFGAAIIMQILQYYDRETSVAYLLYTLFILIATSIYFDKKLTFSLAMFIIISSLMIPIFNNRKFIALFNIDEYASFILCTILIALVIIKQVSMSNSLINSNQDLYTKAICDHLTGGV